MKKAVFISTTNIFDAKGNGGVRASKEHHHMISDYFGEKNVKTILFVNETDFHSLTNEPISGVTAYKRISNKLGLLFAACFGCRVYFPWQEKAILRQINDYNPDLIFLDFSIAGRLLKTKANCKKICFFHNIESDYALNKVKNEGLWFLPAYTAALLNDKIAVSNASTVMCFNKRDSNRLKMLYGRSADFMFPISFNDRFEESLCQTSYSKRILFLGSCFGPNEDGIEWFIKEVMPKLPEITLDIVGLGFENKKEQYNQYKNINIIGTVDDTAPYYYSHLIVIMPIRYGAGMKVKTAEAMMYGRYILASSEALEGYETDNIDGIYNCNTATEYVSAIKYVFSHYSNQRYNTYVRQLFINKYETSHLSIEFQKAITSILEK